MLLSDLSGTGLPGTDKDRTNTKPAGQENANDRYTALNVRISPHLEKIGHRIGQYVYVAAAGQQHGTRRLLQIPTIALTNGTTQKKRRNTTTLTLRKFGTEYARMCVSLPPLRSTAPSGRFSSASALTSWLWGAL